MPGKPVEWTWFHHPGVSVTVLRRRLGDELLDLLYAYGDACVTKGRSAINLRTDRRGEADYMAAWRLRKAGLVVTEPRREGPPVLRLSGDWTPRDALRADRMWKHRWSGVWSVLAYDVPETERTTRNLLRRFLRRMRMGCLQKSVWISPRDIRPDYADLIRATHLDLSSYLFESRATLGRTDADMVRFAWDWHRIDELHRWYLAGVEQALRKAAASRGDRSSRAAMVREEMSAYLSAMEPDPLLPRPLWPVGYRGPEVFEAHHHCVSRLASASS